MLSLFPYWSLTLLARSISIFLSSLFLSIGFQAAGFVGKENHLLLLHSVLVLRKFSVRYKFYKIFKVLYSKTYCHGTKRFKYHIFNYKI